MRERIAAGGLALYRERLSQDLIAAQLATIVSKL